MGLVDIINGMQQGSLGQPQGDGGASSGGMPPTVMALLGLLAYKAVQYLGNQPGQQASTPANPAGGGLGGLLGGLFGGGGGAAGGGNLNEMIPGGLGGLLGGLLGGGAGGAKLGGSLNETIPGGLGGLLGGAGAGGLLTGGLGKLLQDFQNSGQGSAMQSWIGNGPNQPISPKDLESAIGNDTLDALAKHTGMSREDLLSHLSQTLPGLVDQLTPHGRLPTHEEASRMM